MPSAFPTQTPTDLYGHLSGLVAWCRVRTHGGSECAKARGQRRRQRQATQHHGLVPTPPPPILVPWPCALKDPPGPGHVRPTHTGTAVSPSRQHLGEVWGSSAVWVAVRPDNRRWGPNRAGEVRSHRLWGTAFGANRDPPPPSAGCGCPSCLSTEKRCGASCRPMPRQRSRRCAVPPSRSWSPCTCARKSRVQRSEGPPRHRRRPAPFDSFATGPALESVPPFAGVVLQKGRSRGSPLGSPPANGPV